MNFLCYLRICYDSSSSTEQAEKFGWVCNVGWIENSWRALIIARCRIRLIIVHIVNRIWIHYRFSDSYSYLWIRYDYPFDLVKWNLIGPDVGRCLWDSRTVRSFVRLLLEFYRMINSLILFFIHKFTLAISLSDLIAGGIHSMMA